MTSSRSELEEPPARWADRCYVARLLEAHVLVLEPWRVSPRLHLRDLLPDLRAAIAHAQPVTPPMRDRFMATLADHAAVLATLHPWLVVAQTCLKRAHRRRFARRFRTRASCS